MQQRTPSRLAIIQTDYLAFLGALFPITLMVVFGLLYLNGEEISSNFLLVIAALSIGAVLVLFWRIREVSDLYAEGVESEAIINNTSFFRGRGRITFIYTFQGVKYSGSNLVMKNKRTDKYRVGDKVIVLVNRNQPKKSCIQEMYI
jgi:hypothetical protein